MENRVTSIANGTEKELIWLLEHPPVYTAGTSAKPEDLTNRHALPVHKSSRGGQYTHHAQGQRVIYLMLDLKKRFAQPVPDVRKYVKCLEELIIRSLARLKIKGERREGRIGIWIADESKNTENKIAAIGVRFTKGITMHGLAININNDLDLFSGIIPCGIKQHGVCSLKSLGFNTSLQEFDEILMQEIETMLNIDFKRQCNEIGTPC